MLRLLDKFLKSLFFCTMACSLFSSQVYACEKHQKTATNSAEQHEKVAPKEKSESSKDLPSQPSAQNDSFMVATAEVQPSSVKETQTQIKTETTETLADNQKEANASENTQAQASEIAVVEFVLANQVEAREPKIVESFTKEDQRGFAFARLNVKGDDEVVFVWSRDGHEINRTTLSVHAAKKWRTYASVKLKPGNWKVQLLSKNQVLAEKTFVLE